MNVGSLKIKKSCNEFSFPHIPIGFQIANQKTRRRWKTLKGWMGAGSGQNSLKIPAPLPLKVPSYEMHQAMHSVYG